MRTHREAIAALSPERQRIIKDKADQMALAMRLVEIRRERKISQKELAEKLKMSQPAISKLENKQNLQLDTLRNLAFGMGGDLEITIKFPEGVSYTVSQ